MPMAGGKRQELDLRGIKCPLNWAKAKVCLEDLERGDILELILDDRKGRQDIPRAAEAEGYVILGIEEGERLWRIIIEK